MSQVVRQEMAHSANGRGCSAGIDEVDAAFGWRLLNLQVIDEVFAVAFPLGSVASVTQCKIACPQSATRAAAIYTRSDQTVTSAF